MTGSAGLTNAAGEATVQGDQLVLSGIRGVTGSFTVAGDNMSGNYQEASCNGKLTMAREPYTGALMTSRLRTIATTVESLDIPNRVITLRGPQGGRSRCKSTTG